MLIDICPDGAVVATGGGYTKPGQTDVRTIYNRNSRYLFNIIDTGGDGICCNTGSQGSYSIFVDSSLQAEGAEFGSGNTELFGKDVCDGVTFKPTNVVRYVALLLPSSSTFLNNLRIPPTADYKSDQQCQCYLVSCLLLDIPFYVLTFCWSPVTAYYHAYWSTFGASITYPEPTISTLHPNGSANFSS